MDEFKRSDKINSMNFNYSAIKKWMDHIGIMVAGFLRVREKSVNKKLGKKSGNFYYLRK